MEKTDNKYKTYIRILKEELVPAMGCTEPIALAYAGAKAREVLGKLPSICIIEVSGNIIKNVKSVIVPNTDGLKGIEAACVAGIIAGDASKVLEVISCVSDGQKKEIKEYLQATSIQVLPLQSDELLDIKVTLKSIDDEVMVRITNSHSHIAMIERNGKIIFKDDCESLKNTVNTDRNLLNVKDIYDFANSVDILEIHDCIERQIHYNSAIAKEGLEHSYGANIGSVIMHTYGDDIKQRAKAVAAAGSDARMSGCEMPVIINSGSGNQGMTVSLPVIEYAKVLHSTDEQLYRALVLANLIAIHQKTGLGRLSAYCGAVNAGVGAGCGIAYLNDGDYKCIAHTIVNALAIVSGIVCDGAKPSCAAKIASAVDAGILGYHMYLDGQQFKDGDGIVTKGVENTIRNVCRLGKEGMKETDLEIIKIMTNC